MKTAFLSLAVSLLLGNTAFAQSFGEIKGKIVTQKGAPIEFATVTVKLGERMISVSSESDGGFKIKPLTSGIYNLEISCIGYEPLTINGVKVEAEQITFLNALKLNDYTYEIGGGSTVIAYKDPLINRDEAQKVTIRAAEISKTPMAKNPIGLIASMSSEISQKPDSDELYFRGSRGGSTVFFIDGVKMLRGTGRYPGGAIGALSVYTGGLPAKFGDTTGGVVVIETRNYFDLYNEHQAAQNQ